MIYVPIDSGLVDTHHTHLYAFSDPFNFVQHIVTLSRLSSSCKLIIIYCSTASATIITKSQLRWDNDISYTVNRVLKNQIAVLLHGNNLNVQINNSIIK